MDTNQHEFSDTERLEWAVRYPYTFKGFCAHLRPTESGLREIRRLIDEELRAGRQEGGKRSLTTDEHR